MKKSTKLYDKLFKTAMATAIATSAIAVVVPETTKASTDEEVFRDVKTASDYYQYVNELFERGFVSGYPDGSFKPTGLLTRAQASKILALNLGLDVTKTFNHTFNDIPQNDWAYPYVAALKEAGVIDGYPDGAFRPNAPITRSQMAKIIVNGYGLKQATEITFPFTDIATDDWAAPYIQALFDAGITIGQTATTYGGNVTVTRANMAAFTIRSEVTTDYRDNRSPDENIISSIKDNKITIGGQEYYIKKELQPLLHERNLAVLNEANLDFIKIGTKIVGIRNVELLNGGTAEQPLVLDLAGGAVDTNITIAGDYIKIVNANVTGDITVKQGDQKLVEFNGLDLNGRLIIEGDTKHQQESVVKMTDTTVNEVIVNRDKTKIITDNSTPTIKIDSNVSQVEIAGKINAIDFIGKQDVLVKGTLETQELTIETPIKVTLENKVQLPSVETQQYGSQLIVPTDSTIGRLTKPSNVKPEEAVKLPEGGTPKIGMVTDKAEVERPTTPVTPPVTPPTTGGGSTGGSGGGTVTPSFVSQVTTANNIIDAENKDASAVGMVGTRVTTNNSNVATATIKDGKIHITSVGPGTATLIVKEDAPSTKEAQIFVVVDAYGKISYTIKRPETDSFVSETATANNIVDVENKDASAVGMVGTTVTTSNSNVATATIKDGKINITSVGPGTATITVKEDAPSEKESQILVTVDANGKITQKIKRPVEVAQDKLTEEPTPATAELVEIYKAVDINGITLENVTDVTKAVKDAITAKGGSLTEEELKLVVDTALLPYLIKKDNESLEKVSTPLELVTMGPNGTGFEWKSVTKVGSHNANIDLATGDVTRDGADNEDDKVTLNVTASNGSVSKNASIEATILSSNQAFVSETVTANNEVDAANTDPLAVGMIGTSVTSSNPNVATASLKDGEIVITSKGSGTATITVKEDAPSLKEAQITVTVDANGKITHTIKRPVEVVQDKIIALPIPATEDLVKLYEAIDIKGITPINVEKVTAAVKNAIADKGKALTEEELKLTVDIALLPERIKKDNPSLQEVSTPLELIARGPNGTDFDWKSVTKVGNHNANIELATGDVTRDGADNENDKVTLNVTATNGSAINNTSIEATILEAKSPGQELKAPLNITIGTAITTARILNENGMLYLVNMADVQDMVDVASGDLNSTSSVVKPKKELTKAILDELVIGGKAKRVEAAEGVYETIPTDNLAQGIYRVIVVDKAGNFAVNFTTNIVELKMGAATDVNVIANHLTADVIKNQNPSLDEVRTALDLPISFEGASIEWSANTIDDATIAPNGTVTRSANDDTDDIVTLTATITLNGMTTTKTFQVTIKENKAPTIVKVETVDANANGKLDGLKITLSEGIKDSTVDVKDFAIAGHSNLGFNTGNIADDNEIYITFDEGEAFDTDQTPTLTYTEGTSSDLAGNLLGTDSKLSVDKANPILVAVSINRDKWSQLGDTMTLTYSEPVKVDISNKFQDRYPADLGHQIYFPQVDELLGLDGVLRDKYGFNSSGNAQLTVQELPLLDGVLSNKLSIEITKDSFIAGGVPENTTIQRKDLLIPEITDLVNNPLKHTAKTMNITKFDTGVTATKGATTSGFSAATSATWTVDQSKFITPASGGTAWYEFNGVKVSLINNGESKTEAVLEGGQSMPLGAGDALSNLRVASQNNPVKEVRVEYKGTATGFYATGTLAMIIDPDVNSPLREFTITTDADSKTTFTAPAGTNYNNLQFTGNAFDVGNDVQFTSGTAGTVSGQASVTYAFTGAIKTGPIIVTLANPDKTVTVNVTVGQSADDVAEAILTELGTVEGYTISRSGASLTFTTTANAAEADVTMMVQ